MYTLWGVYPGTKRCCYGHTRVGTRVHSLLNIPYSGRYPDTTGVYLSTPLLRFASLSRGEACWLFYFVHGRVAVYEAFFSLAIDCSILQNSSCRGGGLEDVFRAAESMTFCLDLLMGR
ncbi:unnamed protein product [Laminaria digitata]